MSVAALKGRLAFIRRFYFTAAKPFETIRRQFVPRDEPHVDDSAEFEKWKEATKGLEVLGQCSLSLVAKAIQDYLREFVRSEITGTLPKKPKQSWFEFYCHNLEQRTSFRWPGSPVPRDQVEQIVLSRNDFMHDPAIDDSQPVKGGAHFEKYPRSRFDDLAERAVQEAMAQVNGVEPLNAAGSLSVTGQELISAIADAGKFCEFIEAQKVEKR